MDLPVPPAGRDSSPASSAWIAAALCAAACGAESEPALAVNEDLPPYCVQRSPPLSLEALEAMRAPVFDVEKATPIFPDQFTFVGSPRQWVRTATRINGVVTDTKSWRLNPPVEFVMELLTEEQKQTCLQGFREGKKGCHFEFSDSCFHLAWGYSGEVALEFSTPCLEPKDVGGGW